MPGWEGKKGEERNGEEGNGIGVESREETRGVLERKEINEK